MARYLSLTLAVFAAAGLVLAGWGGSSKSAKTAKVYLAWVLNSDTPGQIWMIGSASRQDMGGSEAQHRFAMLKARQELAQMIRVHVADSMQVRQGEKR